MRIANVAGRAALVDGAGSGVDIEKGSDGKFSADPQALFERWDALRKWADGYHGGFDVSIDDTQLGAPTPAPRQVFAIGLNYAEHAKESNLALPESPPVFTKFPASITGPNATITLPSNTVDWEVELVVAIGHGGVGIDESNGWADRKSTRLNSSHHSISYAVFC